MKWLLSGRVALSIPRELAMGPMDPRQRSNAANGIMGAVAIFALKVRILDDVDRLLLVVANGATRKGFAERRSSQRWLGVDDEQR
jgi:hypothetical protein